MVETGDATAYKCNVYTVNATMDGWVFRRQVEGCQLDNGQISFIYTRQQVLEDLVYTEVIATPEQVGQTRFEIYRESSSIGDGRTVDFCVQDVGPEFRGDCTIDPQ